MSAALDEVLTRARACTVCEGLPLGPRPIFQVDAGARILLVGQAPGRITHHKGRPFDDPSGERLRDWLGVTRDQFYDPACFAILPMGFCFPGTGRGGDMGPRAECAPLWRQPILQHLTGIKVTVLLGTHAINWHLPGRRGASLGMITAGWRDHFPQLVPLPHPSPRNRRWFRDHPWFEAEIIPALRDEVARVLQA